MMRVGYNYNEFTLLSCVYQWLSSNVKISTRRALLPSCRATNTVSLFPPASVETLFKRTAFSLHFVLGSPSLQEFSHKVFLLKYQCQVGYGHKELVSFEAFSCYIIQLLFYFICTIQESTLYAVQNTIQATQTLITKYIDKLVLLSFL